MGILTVAYNRPELIRWQMALLTGFCQDPDYELVVVDNSYERVGEMRSLAAGHRYLSTSCDMRGTSQSHIAALVASYTEVRDDYDVIAYLDHDLFPLQPFSIEAILEGYEAAGVLQAKQPKDPNRAPDPRHEYLWPGFLLFRNRPEYRDVVDLSGDWDLNLDSGGNTWKLLEHVGRERCRFLAVTDVPNPYFQREGANYRYYQELLDGQFLHWLNGSGWNVTDQVGQEDRMASLSRVLEERTGLSP